MPICISTEWRKINELNPDKAYSSGEAGNFFVLFILSKKELIHNLEMFLKLEYSLFPLILSFNCYYTPFLNGKMLGDVRLWLGMLEDIHAFFHKDNSRL